MWVVVIYNHNSEEICKKYVVLLYASPTNTPTVYTELHVVRKVKRTSTSAMFLNVTIIL